MSFNFDLQRVADSVWCITLPLPGSSVTIYLVKTADTLALIDTGYKTHVHSGIAPALAELGLHITDLDLVLCTHGHPDHVGGNAEIARLSGARICLHRADAKLAGSANVHIDSDTDISAGLRAIDDNIGLRERLVFLEERVEQFDVTTLMDAGDRVDLGSGWGLEVVATPGHSDGSVSFWAASHGVAFAGDAVQGWGTKPGILPLYFNPTVYLQSLERLTELAPETLCLGHNVLWSGYGDGSSAIRTEQDLTDTLADSRGIVTRLDVLCAAAPTHVSLAEQICLVASQIEFSFLRPGQSACLDATIASTLASHIRRKE